MSTGADAELLLFCVWGGEPEMDPVVLQREGGEEREKACTCIGKGAGWKRGLV